MKRLTFSQAAKPKDGWAHVTEDSDYMIWSRAYVLSRNTCTNHKSVYNWAIKYNYDLKGLSKAISGADSEGFWDFLEALLNGGPLKEQKIT